jgi:hypothetical protein
MLKIKYLIDKFYKLAGVIASDSESIFSNYLNIQITREDLDKWNQNNSKEISLTLMNKPEIRDDILYFNGRTNKAVIGKTRDSILKFVNDDITVKKEAVLNSTDKIPKLYFLNFTIDDKSKSFVSKDFAQNDYLVDVFRDLFAVMDINKVEEFYNQHKARIDNLRPMFSHKPKFLGAGIEGIAFDVGKGIVLKFFTDAFIYNKALESIRLLHDKPELAKTEVMIYGTGCIGEYDGLDLYYIFVEKVRTIEKDYDKKDLKIIVKTIDDYIRFYNDDFLKLKEKYSQNKLSIKDLKEHIENAKKVVIGRHRDSVELFTVKEKLRKNWIDRFIEEIFMKYITSRGDLNMENLGYTNTGDLRYFDPTSSQWQNELNVR